MFTSPPPNCQEGKTGFTGELMNAEAISFSYNYLKMKKIKTVCIDMRGFLLFLAFIPIYNNIYTSNNKQ